MSDRLKIYGDLKSGNCYKVKLVCSILEIDHQWIHTDVLGGDNSTPAFLSKNPNGKIPIVELPDGRYLSESNAIINYLAYGSELLPGKQFELAKIQQWQFFEQYSHEPFIAVARFISKYLGLPEDRRADYESKHEGGYKALSIMNAQLENTFYLTGPQLTTADISLYAYTHVAFEGGFNLSNYSAIHAWIARIASHPKYVGMG